jgi:hypothetical protein
MMSKSTILVQITENDYETVLHDLIHSCDDSKIIEWTFPTLEDSKHFVTVRFVAEEQEYE